MAYKKLYRSSHDKIIAGVCGGLADYFEIDPTIIRAAFVALTLAGGSGLLLYIILAIIIPSDANADATPRENLNELADNVRSRAQSMAKDLKLQRRKAGDPTASRMPMPRFYLGLLACFIGVILLIKNFIPAEFVWFWSASIWPLVIIFIGLYLISKK